MAFDPEDPESLVIPLTTAPINMTVSFSPSVLKIRKTLWNW